jgi:hypothetical protein
VTLIRENHLDNEVVQAQIMNAVTTKRNLRVNDLFLVAKRELNEISEEEFVQNVVQLASEGKIVLEDVDATERSFSRFLRRWELNLWFYSALTLTFAAVSSIYLIPSKYPYVIIQWVVGSMFIFFAPGYVTMNMLRIRALATSELALVSVAMSLVIVMFLGALLSFSPWGITLFSSTLSLSGYTLVLAFAASWRKYRYSTKRDGHL